MFAKVKRNRNNNNGGHNIGENEPERIYMLKQCCDMLLAGGYHRARITSLSPFDRVVGGLVWSITASNIDVNVDIIFQENSTIGQRIKLSEQIVQAVRRMKCRLPLQAHQIQGLDYDHLFPVIQWLVRKVLETRALTGDTVRVLSESQFTKSYHFQSDDVSDGSLSFVSTLTDKYKSRRLFKRRDDAAFESTSARTEATLLEYGEKFYSHDHDEEDGKGGEENNKKLARKRSAIAARFETKPQKTDEEVEAEKAKKKEDEQRVEAERVAAIQAKLSGVDDDGTISVGHLMDHADIEHYTAEMMKLEEEAGDVKVGGPGGGKRGRQQAFERQKAALNRQLEELQEVVTEKKTVGEEKVVATQKMKEEVATKIAYNERVVNETVKLEATEQAHPKKASLDRLKAVVMLNESLKKQENQFKANCKEQLQDLQNKLAALDGGESDDVEMRRLLEIESVYNNDLTRLNKLRQILAEKNQEISKIVRAIDDIPTRAELIQYERRFVELFELVADKLVETRKYYDLYNTLEETHQYMVNEVSLLESISAGFPNAMKTLTGKEEFNEQFEAILNGVEQNIDHVKRSSESENAMADVLREKHAKLLEKQRRYFKAVKEFQGECYKNEKLTEALDRAQKLVQQRRQQQ